MTVVGGSGPHVDGASPVPPLPAGVCQVWWAARSDARSGLDALLAPTDLERRARSRRTADRERATVAYAVVRSVLGVHAQREPAGLLIDRTCGHCGRQHGKPRVPEHPDLHFSVSHSGDCVVVAVQRDEPVGVDVEEVAPWATADLDEVAQLTLSPEERAVLARQRPADRALAFTTSWTRKEAAVKVSGAGLVAPLDEVEVSPVRSAPRVLRWGGGTPPVLHALTPPAGYVGTLATGARGPTTVVEMDAGPLLRSGGPSISRQSNRRLSSVTTRSQR